MQERWDLHPETLDDSYVKGSGPPLNVQRTSHALTPRRRASHARPVRPGRNDRHVDRIPVTLGARIQAPYSSSARSSSRRSALDGSSPGGTASTSREKCSAISSVQLSDSHTHAPAAPPPRGAAAARGSPDRARATPASRGGWGADAAAAAAPGRALEASPAPRRTTRRHAPDRGDDPGAPEPGETPRDPLAHDGHPIRTPDPRPVMMSTSRAPAACRSRTTTPPGTRHPRRRKRRAQVEDTVRSEPHGVERGLEPPGRGRRRMPWRRTRHGDGNLSPPRPRFFL